MMKETIIGLFDSYDSATRAVNDLEQAGFVKDEISLVTRDHGVQERLAGNQTQTVLETASAGAIGGTAVGSLIGLLAGASIFALPGVGPVLATGALATAIGTAAAGAGLGAAYGGFMGALIGIGISEEDAHRYVKSVEQGGVLITVETSPIRTLEAINIIRQANALDVDTRPGEWKIGDEIQSDKTAAPSVTDEIKSSADQHVIALLNNLIKTCKDSQSGFQAAANNVKHEDLKAIFMSLAKQRARYAATLQQQVRHLGGDPEQKGRLFEAIRRGWINIKAAMTIEEKSTAVGILAASEHGEVAVMQNYREALEAALPLEIRTMIENQYIQIQEAYQRIHTLKEATR